MGRPKNVKRINGEDYPIHQRESDGAEYVMYPFPGCDLGYLVSMAPDDANKYHLELQLPPQLLNAFRRTLLHLPGDTPWFCRPESEREAAVAAFIEEVHRFEDSVEMGIEAIEEDTLHVEIDIENNDLSVTIDGLDELDLDAVDEGGNEEEDEWKF